MQSRAESMLDYDSVVIAPSFVQRMISHAENSRPIECCGVLGGRGCVVTSVYPLQNSAESETQYLADPGELFHAIRKMRAKGEEMIGIYHSHPAGTAEPSATDRAQNEYPGLFYFILSLAQAEPVVRCYVMTEDREFQKIKIV